MTIDIDRATHEELVREYDECDALWCMYSCDCLSYYMTALHNKILSLRMGFKMMRKKIDEEDTIQDS